jgi:hypothetical protein
MKKPLFTCIFLLSLNLYCAPSFGMEHDDGTPSVRQVMATGLLPKNKENFRIALIAINNGEEDAIGKMVQPLIKMDPKSQLVKGLIAFLDLDQKLRCFDGRLVDRENQEDVKAYFDSLKGRDKKPETPSFSPRPAVPAAASRTPATHPIPYGMTGEEFREALVSIGFSVGKSPIDQCQKLFGNLTQSEQGRVRAYKDRMDLTARDARYAADLADRSRREGGGAGWASASAGASTGSGGAASAYGGSREDRTFENFWMLKETKGRLLSALGLPLGSTKEAAQRAWNTYGDKDGLTARVWAGGGVPREVLPVAMRVTLTRAQVSALEGAADLKALHARNETDVHAYNAAHLKPVAAGLIAALGQLVPDAVPATLAVLQADPSYASLSAEQKGHISALNITGVGPAGEFGQDINTAQILGKAYALAKKAGRLEALFWPQLADNKATGGGCPAGIVGRALNVALQIVQEMRNSDRITVS